MGFFIPAVRLPAELLLDWYRLKEPPDPPVGFFIPAWLALPRSELLTEALAIAIGLVFLRLAISLAGGRAPLEAAFVLGVELPGLLETSPGTLGNGLIGGLGGCFLIIIFYLPTFRNFFGREPPIWMARNFFGREPPIWMARKLLGGFVFSCLPG